jgi:hypothetical protein
LRNNAGRFAASNNNRVIAALGSRLAGFIFLERLGPAAENARRIPLRQATSLADGLDHEWRQDRMLRLGPRLPAGGVNFCPSTSIVSIFTPRCNGLLLSTLAITSG